MLKAAPILFLSACAFTEADGASVDFVGLGQQQDRDGFGGVYVTESRVFGAWVETAGQDGKPAGGGVGWRSREVIAIPFECKAVFVVQNEAQLAQAMALAQQLGNGGDEICGIQE